MIAILRRRTELGLIVLGSVIVASSLTDAAIPVKTRSTALTASSGVLVRVVVTVMSTPLARLVRFISAEQIIAPTTDIPGGPRSSTKIARAKQMSRPQPSN